MYYNIILWNNIHNINTSTNKYNIQSLQLTIPGAVTMLKPFVTVAQ
jgi:hypothetical protein